MTRKEEKALIRAVLAIGYKVSKMKPDPLYYKEREGSAMFYTTDDHMELLESLYPLRQILDGR